MRHRRGFSLLETAIILGIMGVVISGIWALASSSRQNMQANLFHQQTLNLVKNVRDYYAGFALPTAAASITATLRAGGIFPEEMCPTNCVSGAVTTVYNTYGGTATVAIPGLPSTPINQFEVTYTNVPEKGCIQLGMMLSARSSEVGLVSYNGGAVRTTFPLSLQTVEGDCAATGNTIVLVFTIRN